MALINCPACTKPVSDLANACPKCGHPIQLAPYTPKPKSFAHKVFNHLFSDLFAIIILGICVAIALSILGPLGIIVGIVIVLLSIFFRDIS